MKLSANLGFLYTDLPMTDRIAAAAQDGFAAVEFHWPYDTPAVELRAALEAAAIPGLALNTRRGNVEAGDFGLAAVPGREAEALAGIAEAIDYAAEAGVGAVHVMAGRTVGARAEATFVKALGVACARAAEAGCTILIEPLNSRDVPGYFLTGTDHARRIVEAVNHPALRIMYDIYHMQIMQGDHVARIVALGDLIGHLQIASVPDRAEPDAGEVDMKWLLGRIGYEGFVGAEYQPTRPARDWLTDLGQTCARPANTGLKPR